MIGSTVLDYNSQPHGCMHNGGQPVHNAASSEPIQLGEVFGFRFQFAHQTLPVMR